MVKFEYIIDGQKTLFNNLSAVITSRVEELVLRQICAKIEKELMARLPPDEASLVIVKVYANGINDIHIDLTGPNDIVSKTKKIFA